MVGPEVGFALPPECSPTQSLPVSSTFSELSQDLRQPVQRALQLMQLVPPEWRLLPVLVPER